MNTHKIDAENKKVGRVATQVAVFLMGKDRTDFVKNRIPDVKVIVENASKLSISEKKRDQKSYKRYSGYPGGLHTKTMKQTIADKGNAEVLKKAVYGMLPKNTLRSKMMKNLVITE